MKYVKIIDTWKNFNTEYGYRMKISNVVELLKYIEMDNSFAKGVEEYVSSEFMLCENTSQKGKMTQLIESAHQNSGKDLINTAVFYFKKNN